MQITYRNMETSNAVSTRIREEAAKLDEFFPRITSCRVVVEAPHRHQKSGDHFQIRIELGVPGCELVVSHQPSLRAKPSRDEESDSSMKLADIHPDHKDVYVTLRDAFASARRQLKDYGQRLRGDVKSHQ